MKRDIKNYLFSGRIKITSFSLLVWISIMIPQAVFSQLQTERIFTNGMVLQRDMEVPVWGVANPLDTVVVTVDMTSGTAYADESGNWELSLGAMSAGGPYQMIISNGDQTITRSNVYIGDVWLASGQSNMEMLLSQSDGGTAEAAAANNETIRQFKIPKASAAEPVSTMPAGSSWSPATASYAGNFTAVGYYFARDLQPEIGVPIGIINASYGGARIEAYMSDDMLGFDETWVTLAAGETERQPTLLYNAMIHPILRVPLKGIIWYQGESNADTMEDALAYGDLFQRMINAWRALWGYPELPFIWVQLPGFGTPAVEDSPSSWDAWPQLRAGQSRALSLPYTGEAVAMDVGDVDIHPTNKEPVGHRLSLIARQLVYGEDIAYSGPRYRTHDLLEDGKMKVKFDHIGDSLMAFGTDGDTLHWFSLADNAGNLYPAKAVLDGDSVLVWNDALSNPAVLRYAWEYNPEGVNLYNSDSLPAAPFMVDVVYPGFEISKFSTTDTLLERGSSAILTWKVHGASDVSLNDMPVDSIGGMEVWPVDTSSYKLRAIDRLNPDNRDSLILTINVIDPLPTIYIESDQGELVEPETEITITAEANAPGGGSVVQVEFFVDGTSISIDTEAPWEAVWTPMEEGDYTLTAIVTNDAGVSVESDPLIITVAYLVLIIWEAEDASFTGNGTVRSSGAASGGQYVDLQDGWVLSFDNVEVDSAGTYNLHIRYLLNYESPKTQHFWVNDELITDIEFTAPNTSTWMTHKIYVDLQEGTNKVEFECFWCWMSFDYIAIAVPGEPEEPEESLDQHLATDAWDLQVYPNPSDGSAKVCFSIPEAGRVSLDLMDINGKQIVNLMDALAMQGENTLDLSYAKLTEGSYLLRLSRDSSAVLTKKIVVVK